MTRSRAKFIDLLLGLVALGTLLVAARFWQDIAATYYVVRLHSEPCYLVELLSRPEGPIARTAVERFIRTSVGTKALVSAYVRIIRGWLDDQYSPSPFLAMKTGIFVVVGPSVEWASMGPLFNGGVGIDAFEGMELLQRMNGFLPAISGAEVVLEDQPHRVVSVLPMGEVTKRTGWVATKSPFRALLRADEVKNYGGPVLDEPAMALLIQDRRFRLGSRERILGEWDFVAATLLVDTIDLRDDGSLKVTQDGRDRTGRYSLENNKLTLRFDQDSEETYRFSFTTADELVLRNVSPRVSTQFRRREDTKLLSRYAASQCQGPDRRESPEQAWK